METRLLVAYGLIALLLAFFGLLGWLNLSRRVRQRRREERMRDRWLGRRPGVPTPLPGDVP